MGADDTPAQPIGTIPPMHAIPAAFACVVVLACSGCASEGFEVSAHTQSVAYRGHIDPSLILRAVPASTAILPGQTQTTYGGLASHVDATFLLSFNAAAPGHTVLTPGESIARMNAAGVARDWQALAYTYGQTGVMDQERLTKIGAALGVRHVVVPTLGYIVTNAEQQVQPFGITIAVTTWVSVYASLQVWHVERGTIEWSSTASCSVAIEAAAAAGYPIHQALRKCWDQMLTDLLENRRGSVMHVRMSMEAMQESLGTDAASPRPASPDSPPR